VPLTFGGIEGTNRCTGSPSALGAPSFMRAKQLMASRALGPLFGPSELMWVGDRWLGTVFCEGGEASRPRPRGEAFTEVVQPPNVGGDRFGSSSTAAAVGRPAGKK
jgi:hypothetical protein